MQEASANELPRRRVIRSIGAAGMALAMLLTVGACKATGGGFLAPSTGIDFFYNGDANFGFNFICDMDQAASKAKISGEMTYHDSAASHFGGMDYPEIRIHGVVDPFSVLNVTNCEQAVEALWNGRGGAPAQFDGTYCPQDQTLCVPGNAGNGRFTVLVFDQGLPGRQVGDFTGDYFSIGLEGGRYLGYSRAGYIEGGNIQVYA